MYTVFSTHSEYQLRIQNKKHIFAKRMDLIISFLWLSYFESSTDLILFLLHFEWSKLQYVVHVRIQRGVGTGGPEPPLKITKYRVS